MIAPLFNRLVIFETNEHSYHGHPKPLNTPKGVTRKSAAVYYYTKERPAAEIAQEHNTIYVNTEGSAGKIKTISSALKAFKRTVMEKKLRILHIENAKQITGGFNSLLSFCRRYDNWEHIWVLPKNSSTISIVEKEFEYFSLDFIEVSKKKSIINYVPRLIKNATRLRKIIIGRTNRYSAYQ
jgi:hypothetical protein